VSVARWSAAFVAMTTGVYATFVAPWWIAGRRLDSLLTDAPSTHTGFAMHHDLHHDAITLGVRATQWLLPRLARLPRSAWRNTCLYQSVAECVLLRTLGISATLVLGVRSTADAIHTTEPSENAPAIAAHAWVTSAPRGHEGYVPLTPARPRV